MSVNSSQQNDQSKEDQQEEGEIEQKSENEETPVISSEIENKFVIEDQQLQFANIAAVKI